MTVNNATNGIDKTKLEKLTSDVKSGGSESSAHFNIHTKWVGQTKSIAQISEYHLAGTPHKRDFTIVSDEPAELLGKDTAPGPMELLLAALNACLSVTYVTNAAAMGISLNSLEIEADTDLDLRGFLGIDNTLNPGVNEIYYKVKISALASDEDIKSLHDRVIKTSPNLNSLSRPVSTRSYLEIIR